MNQKGFSVTIIVLIIVAILAIGGGVVYYTKLVSKNNPSSVGQKNGSTVVDASKLAEKKLFTIPDDHGNVLNRNIFFSQDKQHFLYSFNKDNKWFMVVDGKLDNPIGYDRLSAGNFYSGSNDYAYWVKTGGNYFMVISGKLSSIACQEIFGPYFSPSGQRLAYVCKSQAGETAVMDERMGSAYRRVENFSFNSEGNHFAYKVQGDGGELVVFDGRENTLYNHILWGPLFSPDGKHTAYGAVKGDGQYVLVYDGKQELNMPGPATSYLFSSDSSRFGYIARLDRRYVAVVNGEVSQPYVGLVDLTFSPDGKHYAYAASENGKDWFAVLDGRRVGQPYDEVWKPTFGFDGKELVYYAKASGQSLIVRGNGQEEGNSYQEVWRSYLTFSPDSSKLAYPVKNGSFYFVVTNGQEDKNKYDDLNIFNLTFSPDSKHLFYNVKKGGWKEAIVLDGRENTTYDGIWKPVFSSDSKILFFNARIGRELWLKVNRL